jgi:hypothetical protein
MEEKTILLQEQQITTVEHRASSVLIANGVW